MRIYFDTEFIEDGRTIDLISIGMVREDGKEYYAISTEFKARKASRWVKDNVLKYLPPRSANPVYDLEGHRASKAWKSRKQIAQEIVEFAGDSPVFYAYYADYDWVSLCQLYGTMMDLPSGWPMYARDIKQIADEWGVRLSEVVPQENEHHALADALWNKKAHEWLLPNTYP